MTAVDTRPLLHQILGATLDRVLADARAETWEAAAEYARQETCEGRCGHDDCRARTLLAEHYDAEAEAAHRDE